MQGAGPRRGRGSIEDADARPQARSRRRRSTPSSAASICSPRPASTSTRRRVLRRVRPQPRVLHGLRVRADRAAARPDEPGRRRRPLRQPAGRRRRARRACRPSARASTPSACSPCSTGGRGMSEQARARAALQGPPDGAVQRRAGQGRAHRRKSGSARGYKGEIAGLPDVEVNFVSSSEIAQFLKTGTAHLGITGEDLIRETHGGCRRARRASCAAAASAAPTWWWRCRPAGSTCGAWRTSRRWRSAYRRAARPARARRHQVHEPDAPLLHPPRRHRLPHRREPGRHRGRAGGRPRRADRRHHHHRRDAAGQRPRCWTTA